MSIEETIFTEFKLSEPKVDRYLWENNCRDHWEELREQVESAYLEAVWKKEKSGEQIENPIKYAKGIARKKIADHLARHAGFDHEERVFADHLAQTAWEIAQNVGRVSASLPPEGQRLDAQVVTFDPEYAHKCKISMLL